MRGSQRLLALVLTATLVLSAVGLGVGAAPVLAQDDPEPVPAAYYGEVRIDGEPAPAGTHVAAVVDGVQQDATTIDEPGEYGEPKGTQKLEVSAESDDEVQFFVNGEPVDTDPSPVVWEAADTEQVDLAGTDVGQPNVAVEIDGDASVTDVGPNETAAVVAEVTNTGDGDALERTIAFTVDGERHDEAQVSLSPGESRELRFTAEFDAEGQYRAAIDTLDDSASVTLTVDESAGGGPGLPPPPPEDPGDPAVTVTEASLSESEIATGESVTIRATLENSGEDDTSVTLPITVDGTEVATETVYVDGDSEAEVTFTRTFDEAGEYAIAVDGVDAGTLTVGADVRVTDASLDDTEVAPGDSVAVTGTVENAGSVAAETTVELLIDGEAVDSKSVNVDAGGSTDVTFEHAFEGEGEYAVAIDDASAGTVTVSDDAGGGDGIPGFGPAAAAVALLALATAGIATRRP